MVIADLGGLVASDNLQKARGRWSGMDQGTTHDSKFRTSGSFGRTISASSSLRRRSLSLSSAVASQIDDEIESESVSEAGDIGDRALPSKRHSESGSICLSIDNVLEDGMEFPIPENNLLQHSSRDPVALNTGSAVTPLPEEIVSPISTEPLVCPEYKNQVSVDLIFSLDFLSITRESKKTLPESLEYISCLVHLAVFGILGVGSFLMGWWGVVFKGDISKVSDYLVIGLNTGYLGSLTTFSGWNQKMLDLTVDGHWVLAFLGFFIGLFLASHSIIFGIETAKGFRWLLKRYSTSSGKETPKSGSNWKVDSCKRHLAVILALTLLLCALWIVSAVLSKEEFDGGGRAAELWLGCIVGPIGVWIRWFLARLNGRGLGKAGTLRWVPFGTLIANVSAACVMAALATVKKAVDTKTCNTVASGIQFGLLGCLSTVSTFIAEFNAMRESTSPWRAYAYALITILISFGLGILIYSVPVWTKGYN
ncbi:hypothetical protein CUMW_061750 [Citrus unshiu]|uniref:Fluoride ion transporter CrcB n=1 Tax=Citrus unshiu TaxID=55188 RepID=A0A2H5NNH4_CITUN|nr:hypothetical protein CUMW_061750 [Citrus unshiu]